VFLKIPPSLDAFTCPEFIKGEPYIGMPIRPLFRTENPTYTILDVSWIPKN